MEIQKIGHCCLLIKDAGLKILTDPGMFWEGQNSLTGIGLILITHEHRDHFHIDSLKLVLANNPAARVVTNSAVKKLLDEQSIACEVLEEGSALFGQVSVEAYGRHHADIYEGVPVVHNTGYFISERLFYPGDAFTDPGKPVEILALPVSGPWMHIRQCIDYAKLLKPKSVFPVHDGFLKFGGPFYDVPRGILEASGIKFIVPSDGMGGKIELEGKNKEL